MREARNDRPRTLTSGSSSAPSSGTNARTTTCVSSSRSSRSSGWNRRWRHVRRWHHGRRASTSRFTGRCWGRTPLRPRSHPRRRPLRRPRCRAACARQGGPRPGWADRAERRPRQCSRRKGNAGLRHRRWHDPARPAAGAVPRSHRGRAGRDGRRAESERRRLKRAPCHPDRTAAGAGSRGASLVATTVAARR